MRPFYSKKIKCSAWGGGGDGVGLLIKHSCRVSGSWVKRPGNYLLAPPLSKLFLLEGSGQSNDYWDGSVFF